MGLQPDSGHMELFYLIPSRRHESGFRLLKDPYPHHGGHTAILLAVGWALLLGNLVFQALRSMASGLGFEGEDPKLLFARTFVFWFSAPGQPADL